ncbi:MAG: IS3 family transposase [Anaerolineales bacterium]
MDTYREIFPITRLCRVLNISRSGYYAWKKRPVSEREMANQALITRIRAVFRASRRTYGGPRIYRELRSQGMRCSQNRVARLMRLYSIQAKQTKRYRYTTKRNQAHVVAPNRLERDFDVERPDRIWLADITYIPTKEGWLYLAVIMDLYSRRIVGWAMADRMTGQLTIKALRMALQRRQPGLGLIHHSDQGSQYTDRKYQQILKDHGIQSSMNGVGSWYDNAPMESFFASLKNEEVHHQDYQTHSDARSALFRYIEIFYNRTRLHSSLDYQSPAKYEDLFSEKHGDLAYLTVH